MVSIFSFIPDYELASMEVTEISDARIGEKVKISGTINASEQAVIQRIPDPAGEEGDLVWLIHGFNVSDETGTIWIESSELNMTETSKIKPGPHDYSQYRGGDDICIIGTVRHSNIRGKFIWTEHIGKNPDDFYSVSPEMMLNLTTAALISVSISILFGLVMHRRTKLHERNFKKFYPKLKQKIDVKMGKRAAVLYKEPWKEYDYPKEMLKQLVLAYPLSAVMIILIMFMIVVFTFRFGVSFDLGEMFVWWIWSTLALGTFFSIFGLITSTRRRGESRISYKVVTSAVDFNRLRDRVITVFLDLDLRYNETKKEYIGKSRGLIYQIAGTDLKVSIGLGETPKMTRIVVSVASRDESLDYFKDRIKRRIEAALDRYFAGTKIEVDQKMMKDGHHRIIGKKKED